MFLDIYCSLKPMLAPLSQMLSPRDDTLCCQQPCTGMRCLLVACKVAFEQLRGLLGKLECLPQLADSAKLKQALQDSNSGTLSPDQVCCHFSHAFSKEPLTAAPQLLERTNAIPWQYPAQRAASSGPLAWTRPWALLSG